MSFDRSSLSISRRAAFGSLGAAAVGGLAMLNHAVARENNPATQVVDSASSIKITGLRTHRVQSKVYVEIETNHKITGWGAQFMNRPWKVDNATSYATLPEGPGLGIEIDRDKMAKVAAEPNYKWRWPNIRLKDGSVADY